MLEEPEYAFFDRLVADGESVGGATASPVLFRLWVMRRAHSRGRWETVGTAPLPDVLTRPEPRFKQDPISGRLSVTMGGHPERPATRQEVLGLERAAVWEPEHVEERLKDHYAGRTNRWVESMAVRDR